MLELISVIVPVYNVEKYIEKCLESIINQTYRNIEIILVDDGSTDNSGKICDDYAKKYSNITVIHKLNGGLSDARNAGMKIAKGEFICFFDSDDWVEIDILEKAYNKLYENKSDVVIWGFSKDFVDDNENTYKNILSIPFNCNINKEELNYQKLLNDEIQAIIGYAWNKLYKTKFIREYNMQFSKGISLVEDIIFNAYYLSIIKKISFLPYSGTHYVQRARETLGMKFYPNYFELKIEACQQRENILKQYGANQKVINEFMSKAYFNALKSSCRMACLNLSKIESYNYMNKICSSEKGKKIIKNYRTRGKDFYFKQILLYKQFWLFRKIYK